MDDFSIFSSRHSLVLGTNKAKKFLRHHHTQRIEPKISNMSLQQLY